MRVDLELRAFDDERFRRLSSDGFVVDTSLPEAGFEWLVGKCWFLGRRGMLSFGFRLRIGPEGTDPATIDLETLIPPDNMTGWLGIDFDEKRVDICPDLAVPLDD